MVKMIMVASILFGALSLGAVAEEADVQKAIGRGDCSQLPTVKKQQACLDVVMKGRKDATATAYMKKREPAILQQKKDRVHGAFLMGNCPALEGHEKTMCFQQVADVELAVLRQQSCENPKFDSPTKDLCYRRLCRQRIVLRNKPEVLESCLDRREISVEDAGQIAKAHAAMSRRAAEAAEKEALALKEACRDPYSVECQYGGRTQAQ